MNARPTVPDNFRRLILAYPEYRREITDLESVITDIENPELRAKIHARINVELGVVLLKNEEVGQTLAALFEKELKSANPV